MIKFKEILKESHPSGGAWLESFKRFLDHPWQEDSEIDIIEILSQYKDKFTNTFDTQSYLKRWTDQNRSMLNKILFIRTSDRFGDEFEKLVKGK